MIQLDLMLLFIYLKVIILKFSYKFNIMSCDRYRLSQAILPCIHVDREIIAVMVLTKGINKF
jgi:hypothetical protein